MEMGSKTIVIYQLDVLRSVAKVLIHFGNVENHIARDNQLALSIKNAL